MVSHALVVLVLAHQRSICPLFACLHACCLTALTPAAKATQFSLTKIGLVQMLFSGCWSPGMVHSGPQKLPSAP